MRHSEHTIKGSRLRASSNASGGTSMGLARLWSHTGSAMKQAVQFGLEVLPLFKKRQYSHDHPPLILSVASKIRPCRTRSSHSASSFAKLIGLNWWLLPCAATRTPSVNRKHVACCMLHVACCMLHIACCMLHRRRRGGARRGSRSRLHVACCTLHVACCMLHVAPRIWKPHLRRTPTPSGCASACTPRFEKHASYFAPVFCASILRLVFCTCIECASSHQARTSHHAAECRSRSGCLSRPFAACTPGTRPSSDTPPTPSCQARSPSRMRAIELCVRRVSGMQLTCRACGGMTCGGDVAQLVSTLS